MTEALKQIEALCDQRKFAQAEQLLADYFEKETPTAEAWRIQGQIHHTVHRQYEQAIDCYIAALALEPNNPNILFLLGNLYSKELGDVETGMSYYQRLLKQVPDDVLLLNNIGANLLQQKQYKEAMPFFEQVLQHAQLLEAYLGKGECQLKIGQTLDAFDTAHHGLIEVSRKDSKPNVRQQIAGFLLHAAKLYCETMDYDKIEQALTEQVAQSEGITVRKVADNRIAQTKLELSPKNQTATIRYNKAYPFHRYAILCQLISLPLRTPPRPLAPTASDELAKRDEGFMSALKKRLPKKEYERATSYYCAEMAGFLENTVQQLLIDNIIVALYPKLRPAQVSSLFNREGLHAAICKDNVQRAKTPPTHWNARRILYMVMGMHLETIYGINFLNNYQPTQVEYNQACQIYQLYEREIQEPEFKHSQLLDKVAASLDLSYLW